MTTLAASRTRNAYEWQRIQRMLPKDQSLFHTSPRFDRFLDYVASLGFFGAQLYTYCGRAQ